MNIQLQIMTSDTKEKTGCWERITGMQVGEDLIESKLDEEVEVREASS